MSSMKELSTTCYKIILACISSCRKQEKKPISGENSVCKLKKMKVKVDLNLAKRRISIIKVAISRRSVVHFSISKQIVCMSLTTKMLIVPNFLWLSVGKIRKLRMMKEDCGLFGSFSRFQLRERMQEEEENTRV